MGSWLFDTDGGRARVAAAAILAVTLGSSSAWANLRAPRREPVMPSSAVQPIDPASHLRVVHEDLTFRCQGRSCQVTATYAIDADAAIATELAFVLPVDMAVAARVGSASAPTTVTRLNAPPPGFNQRLDVRHEYSLPDGEALPPLYQAVARVSFAPGRNQASFSYEQPLGARESEYSYFHDGTMIPRLLYVLWPLREWKHAPGFTIALRIEMDREPPGWWKRKFGHPAEVYCYGFKGQQTQIGHRLVYTATLSDNFPDYLQCDVGP